MKLKIIVDKACLEASKNCNINGPSGENMIGQNCAIGRAIHDIFPDSWVATEFILFYDEGYDILSNIMSGFNPPYVTVNLPKVAREFISEFDNTTSDKRADMNEIEFEIDVPESVIENIGDMEEVKRLISTSPTLELV